MESYLSLGLSADPLWPQTALKSIGNDQLRFPLPTNWNLRKNDKPHLYSPSPGAP